MIYSLIQFFLSVITCYLAEPYLESNKVVTLRYFASVTFSINLILNFSNSVLKKCVIEKLNIKMK